MQFQLSLHTLINCKSTETRDRFLGDLVLMHCTDEDVIKDIEIKTQTIRDDMHIERNKDMDIVCGSDTVSIPALTASSHNSQSTTSRQMPGLIASSCDSQTSESTMDDIQKIQSLMSTSQNKKTRASRRKNKKTSKACKSSK